MLAFEVSLEAWQDWGRKREGGKVLQSERSTQGKAGNGRKPGLAGTECAGERTGWTEELGPDFGGA